MKADKEQSNHLTSGIRDGRIRKGEVIKMMRSLFSGVSGLKVHQTRMDVIGNNIANINTIGFKSSRTTFSDMLSQLQGNSSAPTEGLGGVNAKQIGLGVSLESIDIIFTDSSPQQTGKNTDLALSGNGLFVLKNGDQEFYTRNGAFSFDENGYYVLPGSGLRVQGWNATDGVLSTNGTPTNIVVPVGKTMKAQATSTVNYSGNLNKESLTISSIQPQAKTGGDLTKVTTPAATAGEYTSVNVDGENAMSAVITLSDGSTVNVTSGYYEVGRSIPITTLVTAYDSLGGKHEVTLLIDKDPTSTDANLIAGSDAAATATTDSSGNPVYNNRWRCYIAPDVGQKGPADASFTNSYTRSASSDPPNPESDGSTTVGTMNNINYLYFDDTGQFISNGQQELGALHFVYSDGNGAAEQDASINFEGLTQYANSTTSFPLSNGNTAGVLQSVAVDGSGIISGTYTNGLVRPEAQIAVAQFNNSAGLTKVGTTIYQESNNSGPANVKTVADFGLEVISSALEMSNVDLATEFSEMIITQRGFQANSKMTTTSDEMLETLVNMKR